MSISGIVSGLWRISRRRVCVCGGGVKCTPDGRELSSVRIFAVAKIREAGAGEILFISLRGYDPSSASSSVGPKTVWPPSVALNLAPFSGRLSRCFRWPCFSAVKFSRRTDVIHVTSKPWGSSSQLTSVIGGPDSLDSLQLLILRLFKWAVVLFVCFRRAFIWVKSVTFFK